MQERSDAERRATTGPVAGFYEGRPGGARSVPEGGRLSHITNVLTPSIQEISTMKILVQILIQNILTRRFGSF